MDNLAYTYFSQINLNDNFDSLKADYTEFSSWFIKKSQNNEAAYVLTENNNIDGFMYLKIEEGQVDDISPPLAYGKHLKVGTFKFNSKGTRRGERFIKKMFDIAIENAVNNIYVTIFDEHAYLIKLFQGYGFRQVGVKDTPNGQEKVLVRDMSTIIGNPLLDYPYILPRGKNKFLLSIYPQYHSRMLPDSILNNEHHDIIQDVSHTNSIHKIYICGMDGVTAFSPGDVIVVYRTNDQQGPARYRSVVTSICIFEEYINLSQFPDADSFIKHCISYSIFDERELRKIYTEKKYTHIIKFTYNAALTRRLTRGELIDIVGLDQNKYWGVMSLTDNEFSNIAQLGGANESIIIN